MVSIVVVLLAIISVRTSVPLNGVNESKLVLPGNAVFHKLKNSRIFTVEALEDSSTHGNRWKLQRVYPCQRFSRIQTSPEKCKAIIQGLTDSGTGELVWDDHRCTVLTLVYQCHAKVWLLSRSGRGVQAEGDDRTELLLEILVDDERKRVIPLDGVASRELSMILNSHKAQEGQSESPDVHLKKQNVLTPEYFGQEQQLSGFVDCA